jgi:hypothetical protein
LQFRIVSLFIKDDLTCKEVRWSFRSRFGQFYKANKSLMARLAAKDTNIGAWRERHGDAKLPFVEDKEDLVTIFCGVSSSMVFDLLAVVLRREY